MVKESQCLLDELTDALVKDDRLKAVLLDASTGHVSYALQPGQTDSASATRIRELVGQISPEALPRCTENATQAVCSLCTPGRSKPLPKGIRVVSLPGPGLLLEKESCETATKLWKWRQFPWVTVKVREIEATHEHHDGRLQLMLAILCGLLTLCGFVIEKMHGDAITPLALACYLGAYLSGGLFATREVFDLLMKRVLDVHFLMLAVAAGAAVIGHWWEGAVLLFLFSMSDALEDMAMNRTEREIKSLFKEAPREATVLGADGQESRVAVDSLLRGMSIRVKPGESIPVDAEVIDGSSATDESNLTGEAIPVDKKAGDRLLAGTMNLWGKLDARVEKPATESALSKIIKLIQNAQESKAPSQRLTDRFGSTYTLSVLALCTGMFFVWWLLVGMTADQAFYRTMTLLVVASPCALVLSIPSAILAGIATGARHGVLFRGGAAIEKLAEVHRVAMDKTGTLTTGHLKLTAIESDPAGREKDLLRYAAALGQNSLHPVSQAIVRDAKEKRLPPMDVTDFRSLTGMGVSGNVGGDAKESRMGRRSLFEGASWITHWPAPDVGFTETLVETPGLRGRLLLQDEVRTNSARLIRAMRDEHLQPVMLTGDRPEAAAAVSKLLDLPDVLAGLTPEDKVKQIKAWSDAGERVAMVGAAPSVPPSSDGTVRSSGSSSAAGSASVAAETVP